jgi:hypothetical protein
VDRHLIVERNDPKVTVAQLRHARPESIAVPLLGLDADWVLKDRDAPLAAQVRSLTKNLGFEILGESVIGHATY